MAHMCFQLVLWFYRNVWGPESLCDEESLTPMIRVLVSSSFLLEGNQRASIGMIKQSIACENTKMQCWMFKEGMYEYMMNLLWGFVRRIHGSEKHIVRGMLRSTHFNGLTVMVDVE